MNETELQQGKALLRRRSKMKKSVRIRSKDLMKEGFTNMQDSNFQQAVVEKNDDEIQSLIQMQKSFDSTINAWQNQKDRVVTDIKNKPQEYQDCVESCRKNKVDDALNACLYGCGIGKYASASTTYRGNKPPPPSFWQDMEQGLVDLDEIIMTAVAIVDAVAIAAAVIIAFAATFPYSLAVLGIAASGAFVVWAIEKDEGEEEDQNAIAANLVKKSLNKLKGQKKPQNPGDVLTSLAFKGYLNGKEAGDKAAGKAFAVLKNSKYANINPGSLSSADLKAMQLKENMTALQFYEEIMAKFNFYEPFDNLNPLEKLYFLMLLAQTKQGVMHFASTSIAGKAHSDAKLDFYKSQTKEGFNNKLQKYTVGSVTAKGDIITDRNYFDNFEFFPVRMGSYGPVGWLNRNAKGGGPVDASQGGGEEIINKPDLKIKNTINNLLGSSPQAQAIMPNQNIDWLGLEKTEGFTGGSIEQADSLAEMKKVNPDGVRTLLASSTNTFKQIYASLQNDPLLLQMIALDASPEVINKNLNKLEKQWSNIFKTGCAMGITDPNYKPGDNIKGSKTFGGHKQYCKGFQNTKNGRSGYFGQDTIVKTGGGTTSLLGEQITLNNQTNVGTPNDVNAGRMGCDIEIASDQAGYCECIDGTKIYMDGGHPSVSCNDLCYPKNITESGSKQILYHNPTSWKPGTVPLGGVTQGLKAFNQPTMGQGKPWLQCGSGSGEPGECPDGMTTLGKVEPTPMCGRYDANAGFLGIDWFSTPNYKNQLGRKCVVPLPPGGEFPTTKLDTVDNGMGLQIPKGYTKLPSPVELVDECKSAPYDNLYIQILKFRVLDEVLNAKTNVMGKVITQTNKSQIATKMKQSAVGRKLLRDMQKYKRLYKEFEQNEQRKNQLAGMYEDINFKSQSANISYYIWFILAISGMFLVIKKLKSSN
jgi:hypothetical protein